LPVGELTLSALHMHSPESDPSSVNTDETVVRSSCPTCGTVDVPADQVTVLVTATAPRDGHVADPVYRYICPSCLNVVQKPTSPKAVPMLRGAGATIVLVPAEVTERCGVSGPAIDHEDLLDLVRALDSADDLARLAVAPPVGRPSAF
jgi:hypothetical protein